MMKNLLAVLVPLAFFACGGEGPTGPDASTSVAAPAAETSPALGQPVVPPPDPACNIKEIVGTPVNFTPNGSLPDVVKVKITSKGTSCQGIYLTAWDSTDPANQVWFADSDGRFPPTEDLTVRVPCGVDVQLDVNNSPYRPEKGQYSPGYFVGAFWGKGPACPTPSPTPPPTCLNYQSPTITGDISADVQTTQVVFDVGTVAPLGGVFNPTLPQPIGRPGFGQPAGSFSTTYTIGYGPADLQCSVSKVFTKPVPPRDRTCADVNLAASASVSGYVVSITASWNGTGSASVTIGSVTKTITTSGGVITFSDLAPGSYNLSVLFIGGSGGPSCSVAVSFTIDSSCSSEWDRSSYDNPMLNCATWVASLHNGGSGPGLCPVTYHVQKAPLQGPPNWTVVFNGTMPPLGPPGSTGTVSIVTIPLGNGTGKYRVVFDQHPAHPGGSNPTTNSCTYP